MAQVTLKNVRKTFGSFTAVDSLDLVIDSGEFVSLLGPSGCGKTTTLRMLAGLEQLTAGEIRIGDRIVNDLAPSKRDIAMVFQSYALYPHMTVAQNIEYPLRKRGMQKAQRSAKVTETARLLQLEELLGRKPRELSGGQQQRVALGRALVRDPAVFLLDEPLSNLDAKLRAHMRAELIELRQRIGKTMVYVTHDQLEAMTMSDRIAVMSGGILQQFAPPDTIYNRPVNRFVAGFIGTPAMNFIDGSLSRNGSDVTVVAGDLLLPLPAGLISADAADGAAVTIGIRPEDVSIDDIGDKGDRGDTATVALVEPTGHESIVFLDMTGHRIVARMAPDLRVAAGDQVRLTLRSHRLHVFDTKTGVRLNTDTIQNDNTGSSSTAASMPAEGLGGEAI